MKELRKELPYKWRVQSCKYGKATCVAYIDARDVQDLLDEVVGAENWTCEYREVGKMLFCRIGIKTEGGWVYKEDTGSESNIEREKGHVSDAFKRAAVLWGIGRFLYRLEIVTLKSGKYKEREYPLMEENGKLIFDGDTLTRYINWLKDGKPSKDGKQGE